jgi:hypothetical protein
MTNDVQEWTEEAIAEYQRYLECQAAEETRLREVAEHNALEAELGAIANGLLGKAWLQGIGDRLGKDRRALAKAQVVRGLFRRYSRLYEKKHNDGLDHEAAHRASLTLLSRLSLTPEFFTHLPKPRGSLTGALSLYHRWHTWVKEWHAGIRPEYNRRKRKETKSLDAFFKESFLSAFPSGSQRPPQTVIDSLAALSPSHLAAALACAELGITLHPRRAYEEIRRLQKLSEACPETFSGEEIDEARAAEEREHRLRALRDQFGPPPGLPDAWA